MTERAAQIELGKLLEQAAAGRQPETNATVAELIDQYVAVAGWDLSTRKAYEAHIRRVIKPGLEHLQVCKTCATPPLASATAAAGPPRCGTMPTRYRRLTGEPPPTSHS